MNSHPHKKILSIGIAGHGIIAIGVSAHGIVAVGVAAHGIVAIGVIPMGIVSIGVVSMGLASAGLVSMGLATAAPMGMGFLKFPRPEMPRMQMHSRVEQEQPRSRNLVQQQEKAEAIPTKFSPKKQAQDWAQSRFFSNQSASSTQSPPTVIFSSVDCPATNKKLQGGYYQI